jgi:hypothetical protein
MALLRRVSSKKSLGHPGLCMLPHYLELRSPTKAAELGPECNTSHDWPRGQRSLLKCILLVIINISIKIN